jgi:cyclomaltodextrinase / maltogenic alpha-amylase / neopullulanase
MERTWVQAMVWWHLYPLGFVEAGTTAEATRADSEAAAHRLGRIETWLDYAADLGVTGLTLGPIFASESHGYDTVDHYRIDARLGDESDFAHLVAAAHDRGLRILLDGVFNHVGRTFPTFQRAIAQGPDTPEAHWFRPLDHGEPPSYATFEGHEGLVALNHDEPAVADYVADVMEHWLERGADGWRLDAAYAVPTEFWTTVLPRVRQRYPEAYIVGEVIHGDYPAFVASSGVDAVTQYELWKAVWSSINDRNLFELAWTLGRHNEFLDTFVPQTFVGNHDVTRLTSQLVDLRHLPHALVVLLTVGGTPSIYYGDEQGFEGTKEDRVGGDDAIRPGFPLDGPEALAGSGWPVYRLHQELIALRRQHPWLHRGRVEQLHLTNTAFVYAVGAAGQRLVVALNLGDVELVRVIAGVGGVLASGAEVLAEDGVLGPGVIRLLVPAHGWVVLGGLAEGGAVGWPQRGPRRGGIPEAVAPSWQAGHVDLVDAETMARQLIAEHLDTRWTFKWDNAKTRLGACHHRNRTITLSKHFAALNGEGETRDTVLHEIAHALTPGAAHGPAWKKTAARIGARPTARADGGSLAKPDPTWVAECPRCAATLWRYRRSKTPVACARCCNRHNGGRFDPRFVLSWARPHQVGDGPGPLAAAEASLGGEASPTGEVSPAGEPLDPAPAGEPSPGLAPRPGTRPRTFEATHRGTGPATQLDLFADLGV